LRHSRQVKVKSFVLSLDHTADSLHVPNYPGSSCAGSKLVGMTNLSIYFHQHQNIPYYTSTQFQETSE